MDHYVSLTCPSCGGKLQISSAIDRFACSYCGNEHIVRRGDGIVFLQPVVEGLQKVQSGVDKTASELAIKRITEELATLRAKKEQEIDGYRNNYGAGLFIVFLFALLTVCSWFSTGVGSPLIYLVLTIIIAMMVLTFLNKKQKEKKSNLASYDLLIGERTKELRYHQDLVSR